MRSCCCNCTLSYTKVEDPLTLVPILEGRLPLSCAILTQVLMHKKFEMDMEVYSFGSGQDAWIIVKWFREDWTVWISISPPKKLSEDGSVEQFKSTLKSSGVIDWKQRFVISALERQPAKVILDLQGDSIESVVTVYPVQLFYMKPELALKIEIDSESNVRVGPLEVSTGVPFIVDNWQYTSDDTIEKTNAVVRKLIERNVSGGVYLTDETTGVEKLVCGAVLGGNGQLSMLHTDPEHRRKGYSLLCIRFMFREMAQQGLHPCLSGEEVANEVGQFKSVKGLEMIQEKLVLMSVEKSELSQLD